MCENHLDDRYVQAGEGLRKIFDGQMIIIFCQVVGLAGGIFKLAAAVGMVAAFVLYLKGIRQAGRGHPGYGRAFGVVVGQLLLALVAGFLQESLLGALLDGAGNILGAVMVYFICTATSDLLEEQKRTELARRGQLIWKYYAGVMVAGLICGPLLSVFLLPKILAESVGAAIVALVVGAVIALAMLIVGIVLLVFFNSSSKALLAGPLEEEGPENGKA